MIDVEPSGELLPPELMAVITIFIADSELRDKALPHVDMEKREIDWEKIENVEFGIRHSAAVGWAKAIWGNCTPSIGLLTTGLSMDSWLKTAVLRALSIRWGIKRF